MFRLTYLVCLPLLLCWAQRDLRLEHVERRVALVVGNDAYPKAPLKNAANDARVVGRTLQELGFEVEVLTEATAPKLDEALNRFTGKLRDGDVALFYFAGHGVQLDGMNYLIPVDFTGDQPADVRYKAVSGAWVQERMENTGARLKILILDACRNNPFRANRALGAGGLAQMNAGRGSFIAFATGPGQVADDNIRSANGLFTEEFVKVVREPGLPIDEVFNRVRETVDRRSGGKQLPWTSSSLVGQFSFRPGAGGRLAEAIPPTPVRTTPEVELEYWASIKNSRSPALFEAYLRRYPQGQFVEIAEARLAELRVPEPPRKPAGPEAGEVKQNSRDGQRYVYVPAGSFQMGCSLGDMDCYGNEKPAHRVTLSRGYWLGQTEVTVGAYQKYAQASGKAMPPEPKFGDRALNKGWSTLQQPMVNVNWEEAKGYCEWAGLRLPTEAEWEHGARAGSESARYGALDEVAWYHENSGNGPHLAGQKQANGWRLYDMLGSVQEWTQDWYREPYSADNETRDPRGPDYGEERVLRGGSWNDRSRYVRVSHRYRLRPFARNGDVGFRCAGEIVP